MSELISPDVVIACISEAWKTETYNDALDHELKRVSSHPEAEEAKNLFRGKHWQDIDDSILLQNCPNPFLIGDMPLRYYLPAFLICAIRNRDTAELIDFLVEFELKLPKKLRPLEEYRKRFDPLTHRQKQAVSCFLQACVQYYNSFNERAAARIKYSIEHYWSVGK